ncbi:hypothetical protein C0993_011612 [Termitomyces sp. T159_Od127]|nr:hypothetical protein C0993_011612 [Termitomyces sp. T159_Od127]
MLDLIQPLAPTTFGPELTPSKSVAENPCPQTAQCLAAYIIDLTLILYDLFLGTLQGESQRSLSNKLILDAVRRYKDHKSGPVHGDVRDSTTSKRSKGYIADLIYKWLDTSAFFSETDSDVLSPTDLISQLQVIFHDKLRYQRLLASKDEDAQKLLDLFQWLLDMPEVDSSFKRELIIGTQRLCKNSSFYPTCYSLNGIKVTDEVPINSGGFADIYRGEFQGRRVCLKVIRLYQSTVIKDFMKRFSREAILWSQLRHLNVLPFYGLYWYKNQACLISPWMEKGDVTIYLKTEDNADPVSLVLDLTQGLRYLHKLGIVHGDVKGINTLVDRCGRACLADFGLSSVSDANILAWTTLTSDAATSGGSARWQAPELFKDQPKNYASDIYAWSCVCYEIFSGNIPFHNISNNNAVIFQVMQGVRPERPSDARGLTDSMWVLIQDCWAHKPDDRPTIEVVSSRLAREPHVDVRPSESEDMMTPARFRTTMREKPDFSRVSELIQVIRGR